MKVTVSIWGASRGHAALRRGRIHIDGVRLAACVCLTSFVAVAHGASYDSFGNPVGTSVSGPVMAGESVLAAGRPSIVDEGVGTYSESMASDGVQPGSMIVSDGGHTYFAPGGPCEEDCHPGILSALYDHHLSRIAERDAAGLPRHSTTGLVNRVLGPADPRWTAQVDALFLWQQPLDSRVLFTDVNDAPAFNVNEVRSQMGVGPRAALMLNLDCTHAIEANYFNVGGIRGSSELPPTGNGTLYTQNDLVGYVYSDIGDARVTTTGAIQSFELNWRRWNTGAFTWLAGARWVEWNESLSIVDSYVPVDPLESGGTDSFDVLTRNDLYGAQIGTDVLLWNAHKIVRFNALCKAGVFYNGTASQQTNVTSDRVPSDPISVSASGTHTAFFGEVGINGSLKLTEWLSWRAGYNFFWIDGVAVSSRQLSATDIGATPPTTVVNMNGSVMLHGANTGLEARW